MIRILLTLTKILRLQGATLSAIDSLKDNVVKEAADIAQLKVDVEALAVKTAGVPEADVQAQADAVAANDAAVVALDEEVKAALTPPQG